MKCVIFDLDGTLLDTLDDLKNSVNYALSKFNFPPRTRDEVRLFIGNGVAKLLERSCPEGTSEETLKEAFKYFRDYYINHFKDCTKPYEGIYDLVYRLKTKYKLAVVSNKNDPFVKELINSIFPNAFDLAQGTYDDKPKKPDPFICNLVIENLNLNKANCVFVGDTFVDVQTARNTNLKNIVVTYGYRSKEELLPLCPNEIFVDNAIELEKKIDEILR